VEVAVGSADGSPGGLVETGDSEEVLNAMWLLLDAEAELCIGEGTIEDYLTAEELQLHRQSGHRVYALHLHLSPLRFEVQQVLQQVLVDVDAELLLARREQRLQIFVDQKLLVALEQVADALEEAGAEDEQNFGAVVGFVLGHVEGHGVADQEFEVVGDEVVGVGVVLALHGLLPHLEETHAFGNGLLVANDFLILWLVEVLVLIVAAQFLNDPLGDLAALLESASRAAVVGLFKGLLVLLLAEVAVA
jgi:hypothetical protein